MTVIQLKTETPLSLSADIISGQALSPLLQRISLESRKAGLNYAGNVSPEDAWKLFIGGQAHLIDVRTEEERRIVGRVPNTLHIEWQIAPARVATADFLNQLQRILPKHAAILFLCRSGKRSVAAAIAATQAGFTHAFNVSEGFEGNPGARDGYEDDAGVSGWRQRRLPWVRD